MKRFFYSLFSERPPRVVDPYAEVDRVMLTYHLSFSDMRDLIARHYPGCHLSHNPVVKSKPSLEAGRFVE